MNRNIKIILGSLALIAVISSYSLLSSLKNNPLAKLAKLANISQGSQLEEPDNDTDNDGLSDNDERAWGTDFTNPDTDGDSFKDGEEIASGHNPNVAGPDDLINKKQNVTQRISELMLAGIKEGSLRVDSSNFNSSIETLVDEALHQTQVNAVKINSSSLKIIPDTKENLLKYKEKIDPEIKFWATENPNSLLDFSTGLDDLMLNNKEKTLNNFLKKEVELLEEKILKLESMEVPKSVSKSHNSLIYLAKQEKAQYLLSKESKDDPIQTMVILSSVVTIVTESIPKALTELVVILKENAK
jgi:hypothetical protein